jgi:hypothetical protein
LYPPPPPVIISNYLSLDLIYICDLSLCWKTIPHLGLSSNPQTVRAYKNFPKEREDNVLIFLLL